MAQRHLRNYSGLATSYAEWHAPETIADLCNLLERATLERRQVTFRGGGGLHPIYRTTRSGCFSYLV